MLTFYYYFNLDEILISETSEFLKQIPTKKDREEEIKIM